VIDQFLTSDPKLSKKLNLRCVNNIDQLNESNAIFELIDKRLTLHLLLDTKPCNLAIDLADGEVAIRASKVSKSNEVIAKAIGCKPHYRPNVLDATAGMGRDALVMAILGCNVVMQERNFAIYHLLENALKRLRDNPEIADTVTHQISLNNKDSIQTLGIKEEIDVIYLDPMFPTRKKTALVKKEMRLFKLLTGDDLDSDQLLISALNSHVKRVVVKRPKGVPVLAGKKPSHEIKSKKFRYDVYLR